MSEPQAIDELLGRDPRELRESLVSALRQIGWEHKLGKQRGGEQTLLEHSIAVFDALFTCMPFFAAEARPGLTRDEVLGMLLATVAHDAGKASPPFQAYLRGEASSFAEHVDPTEIRNVVVHVASVLGLDLIHLNDIVSEAVLHDRRMRRDRGELAEWSRPHESDRWRKLTDFVNHADSLASAEDVVGAWMFLKRNPLLLGSARPTCYRLRIRGVSTTLLHEAACDAFAAAGHVPISYFATGTLFAATGPAPAREQVVERLKQKIESLFDRRRDVLPELAIGQPLKDFLPRPEYVRRDSIDALLRVATTRARRKAPNTPAAELEAAKWRKQWADHPDLGGEPTPAELLALLEVGPEACAFRLAKELFSKVLNTEADLEVARPAYEQDAGFGPGSFDRLLGQSTYMPVKDYARSVRGWHETLHGGGPVGSMEAKKRTELLTEKLGSVLRAVLDKRVEQLPSDHLVGEWSESLSGDLAIEASSPDAARIQQQLAGYSKLKERRRANAKVFLQCAQCSGLIEPGEEREGSDALGNVGSYSNRRLAFDAQGRPPICAPCVADLELGQLSLGRPIRTVVALVPRRSLGRPAAAELVLRVGRLRSTVDRQLSPETADAASYMALSFPQDALKGDSLARAAVRPVSEKTRKGRAKELAQALLEKLDSEALADLNQEHGTDFANVDALAQGLMSGAVPASLRNDPDVRGAVSGVAGGGRADFAAVTPNLVVVSLDRELGGKESASDQALYSFGLAALFALELDVACLVGSVAELRPAIAGRAGRAVYVPANGPARRLLGGDWLGLGDAGRWLRGVRAAIVLRERAGAGSLLEVLRYPSAGYVIRRIEQQPEAKGIGEREWPFVEALKEVLG